uniref:Uncharacterized protein n=1 Tax=Arundo donax TaxID=35708 RepID=A0A0A9GWZ3_ARUDO
MCLAQVFYIVIILFSSIFLFSSFRNFDATFRC